MSAEIKKKFYTIENTAIYVTEEQFIWEYKWFYHGDDEVYLIAKEYKSNKTITTPIESRRGENLSPKIQIILEEYSQMIKAENY